MNEEFRFMKGLKRETMLEIWHRAKTDRLKGLSKEKRQIGRLMLEHEEYHHLFELVDQIRDYHFDPDSEVNPFFHIAIHSVIENQLESKDPIEVYQFYNSMRKKKMDHHETIHLIGYILAPLLYQVINKLEPFDTDLYRKLLKKYQNKKPEKIYKGIDKDLDFVFK